MTVGAAIGGERGAERLADGGQVSRLRGFIQRDAEVVGIDEAEVDAAIRRGLQDACGLAGNLGDDGVEERTVFDRDARLRPARRRAGRSSRGLRCAMCLSPSGP